jgi:hypothetical protein
MRPVLAIPHYGPRNTHHDRGAAVAHPDPSCGAEPAWTDVGLQLLCAGGCTLRSTPAPRFCPGASRNRFHPN